VENNQETYDNDRPITPNSGVRLSVGLIAMLVFSFAYFLFARDEYYAEKNEFRFSAHESHVESELKAIKDELKTKAATTATEDRFYRRDFNTFEQNHIREREQFKKSLELQFELIEEKNAVQHRALNNRIDHLEHDLESSEKRIDMHYLNK